MIQHAIRLKEYADKYLNVTEDLIRHIQYSITMFHVERIIRHRWKHNRFEVLVKWLGLTNPENNWTDIMTIYAHAPKSLELYYERIPASQKQQLKAFILHGTAPTEWYGQPAAATSVATT